VPERADEDALLPGLHLASNELERERRSILSASERFVRARADLLLIGTQVALEVNQEVALVRRRDQRRDRLANQLGRRVPKERLHPRVDGLQPTTVVKRHDAVGNIVQDASDERRWRAGRPLQTPGW